MKGAGRERIVSGRVFLVIVGDVFFPGNHKTVVIYFGDLYARKAFPPPVKLVSFLVMVAFSEKSDIGVTDR